MRVPSEVVNGRAKVTVTLSDFELLNLPTGLGNWSAIEFMTIDPTNQRRPLRRFFQFGLRTLFVLTTVFAVWLGIHLHRTREQKEAIQAIRNFGGWVYYDFQETPSGSCNFNIRTEPGLPRWMVSALGEDFFYDVSEVNLVYSNDSGQRQENANFSDDAVQHGTDL